MASPKLEELEPVASCKELVADAVAHAILLGMSGRAEPDMLRRAWHEADNGLALVKAGRTDDVARRCYERWLLERDRRS